MGDDDLAALSGRERAVLRHVQRGLQTEQIARALDRSPNTVDKQIASARRKLGGVTRRQAARILHDAEGGEAFDPARDEPEMVREERAYFPACPLDDRDRAGDGAARAPAAAGVMTGLMTIIVIAMGMIFMLAATPRLVDSFKVFTAWLLRTFY